MYSNISSAGESDVREDEEQTVKFQDIIDLLVAAGYFRARIRSIPPFDRVVGGMVWCITLCNHTIDIDLFYSENATIGQKIALTERVVKMLPQLKCPHSIEPHQIQGLDCIHIFPVVQWLVREAVHAKEKFGDNVRKHAVYQFTQRFRFSEDEQTKQRGRIFLNNCREVRARCAPQRIFKRKRDFKPPNLQTDVRCTLMEYGWKGISDAAVQKNEEQSESQQLDENVEVDRLLNELSEAEIQPTKQRLSAKALAQIIDISEFDTDAIKKEAVTVQRHQRISNSVSEAEKELAKLKEEERSLDDSIKILQQREKEQMQEIDEIDERIAEFEQLLNSHDKETVERMKHLLIEHDEIRKHEADFKASCRNELQKLNEELERLKPITHLEENRDDERAKSENLEAERHLTNVRLELADLNRQIAAQQRILDNVPEQTEISQYQRRIIELYNQMASKHRETKQFYILHNTLVDMQTFMKREIDMLNSIDDVQHLTSKESYKESFVENLQKILKGVDATLDKVSMKQKELQAQRDKLSEEYQYVLEKERLYYKTVDDFKSVSAVLICFISQVCHENEELKRQLEGGGHSIY